MHGAFKSIVALGGCSRIGDGGLYCFDATINGIPVEIQVEEEVAFLILGGWTIDTMKCLDILRLHKAELARGVALMIAEGRRAEFDRVYRLTADTYWRARNLGRC